MDRHVRTALAVLAAVCAALALVALVTRGMTAFLLCLTGMAAVVVLLLAVTARRDYDLFEPLTFVGLAAVVGIGLKAPYLAFSDSIHVRDRVLLGHPLDIAVPASALMLMGLAALCAGYMVRPARWDLSRWPPIARRVWDRRRLAATSVAALAVSASTFVVWFRTLDIQLGSLLDLSQKRFYHLEGARYEYSALGYLLWGVAAAGFAFYLLLAWRLSARGPAPLWARLALPVTGFIAIAFPVMRSSRSGVMSVLLVALILVHYLRPRLRTRAALVTGVAGLVLFMAVTGLRAARELPDVRASADAASLFHATVGGRHFMDLGKTALIVDAVPNRLDYRYGATFFTWLAAPIPRAAWREKPTVGSGPALGERVFEVRRAGVPPGIVAELYMNFGAAGVPVGMFLVGVLLRTLYTSFRRHRDNPGAVLLYAVVVVPASFALMQGDVSRVMISILTAVVPLALLLAWIGRPGPGPAGPAGLASPTVAAGIARHA